MAVMFAAALSMMAVVAFSVLMIMVMAAFV